MSETEKPKPVVEEATPEGRRPNRRRFRVDPIAELEDRALEGWSSLQDAPDLLPPPEPKRSR